MRARNIKPGFFCNEELFTLPALFRLVFIGLWTLADREGRLEDRPARIHVLLSPMDDPADVATALDVLTVRGLIARYTANGRPYIVIPRWRWHQRPCAREQASAIPEPPPECMTGARLPVPIRPPLYVVENDAPRPPPDAMPDSHEAGPKAEHFVKSQNVNAEHFVKSQNIHGSEAEHFVKSQNVNAEHFVKSQNVNAEHFVKSDPSISLNYVNCTPSNGDVAPFNLTKLKSSENTKHVCPDILITDVLISSPVGSGENRSAIFTTPPEKLEKPEPPKQGPQRGADATPCPAMPKTTRAPPCPVTAVVGLFHEMLPMLPRVIKVTARRRRLIRARWREDLPALEEWRPFFAYVARLPILTGGTPGRHGREPFRATLEWLITPDNFTKIAEGQYKP